MRFRFCGDLDAPDWLLAEISTLSKIPAQKLKVLIREVVKYILTDEIDYSELSKITAEELPGGYSDTKGAVSALHFAISNSAKYDVEENTLLVEIQQLGLPKDNADALGEVFSDYKDEIRARFTDQAYKVNSFKGLEWRVDSLLGSTTTIDEPLSKEVHLKFSIDSQPHITKKDGQDDAAEDTAFSLSDEKFQILHKELRRAKAQMASINA
mmetsp:Transcript_2916/g.4030  ORF Transcript_2916/g.4030 Transcript_2916/m.4030 type:complete len:211 (+) Transcript_2916:59-691(+)